jgi:hypothetical protein
MPMLSAVPARVEHDGLEGLIEDIKDDIAIIARELDAMLDHQHGSRYHLETVAARDELEAELERLRRERTRLAIAESRRAMSMGA